MNAKFFLIGMRETTADRHHLMLKALYITVTPRHVESSKKSSVSSLILWFQWLWYTGCHRKFMKLSRFLKFWLAEEILEHCDGRANTLYIIWSIKERKLSGPQNIVQQV